MPTTDLFRFFEISFLKFLKKYRAEMAEFTNVISVTVGFGIHPRNLALDPFPKIIVRYYGKVQFTAPVVQSSLDN
jgi:hypothetical protein